MILLAYNTDVDFFDRCLESITESTLRREDYEIIVVDDGSTTDYSELLARYEVRYVKTENRGMLAARSLGIEMARGEYTAFVDSDDTVSFNYHRPMLERAEETGADIVIGDWAFHTARSRYFCRRDSTIANDIDCTGDDVLPLMFSHGGTEHSYFVMWNKLFRTEILRRANEDVRDIAESGERFNYSEDALRCFYAYSYARRVVNVHSGYYFYRIHASQSVNVVSRDSLLSQLRCMGTSFLRMERGLCGRVREDEMRRGLDAWRALMSRTHYSHARAGGYTDLYPVIQSTYGIQRLRISKPSDSRVYINNRVLPANFTDIERELLEIYREGGASISPSGMGDYRRRVLSQLSELGVRIELSRSGRRLTPERYKLRDLIIMNPAIYAISLLLFPKGSRLRAFLKRHI